MAGYDLTFSPVKSVSALWAIAPPDIAARIERAHQGAVADALRFIETHALYTRTGRNGVRQVDVTGLVGTAFTHRDSRAGDRDLHTHVAIANKVQTRPTTDSTDSPPGGGGRWLSIDGRVLFKAVVTASETYSTALETRLRDNLGLRFSAREVASRAEDRKRPVREIVGLPAALVRAWSVRRADIEVRRGELSAQRDHGRPPTPVEALHLAQQANLETRVANTSPAPWPRNARPGATRRRTFWAGATRCRACWPPCSASRQQLYTMLTRGRLATHVYLPVVGDGDPHTVLRPEVVHPRTATEHLEAILARDDTPTSARTLQREQADPAVQLGHATARYLDALHLAAEDVIGADIVRDIEDAAGVVVPGIEHAPAWSTLRAHLLMLAANGADPVDALRSAAADRTLVDAADPAAVLDWRLDDTGLRSAGAGPLPWLPAIPTRIARDDTWGQYLTDRADLAADLAAHVRARANGTPPWLGARGEAPPLDAVAEVEVWRAAVQVNPGDRRPTGPPQMQMAARTWQRTLDRQVQDDQTPARAERGHLIQRLAPGSTDDPFRDGLADELTALSRAGVDARALLVDAAAAGPLPDDHAAAALWWRVNRSMPPASTNNGNAGWEQPPPWTSTDAANPRPRPRIPASSSRTTGPPSAT